MDYYVDVTPAPAPSIFYASQAALGRNPPKENFGFGATQFLTNRYTGLNFSGADIDGTEKVPKAYPQNDSTSLLPKSADARPIRPLVNERQLQGRDLEISKIAEDRIKLLAIKYANDSISAEMIARLEILNSRLIERAPRVSIEQISHLEASIDSIKSVEQSILDRAKRLGLPT
ncbi:hypothetical protein [Pseudomonas sp. COW5]|uniref:hypothetical protein n=1 Tax=Pseudomonas sp. COW5 TaxID=2981253 RepID=UPI002247F699|nr:hypothetical protein [Pseudomonas sp. COW5]MCX2545366.1 hypothetical protein [Pseudomonas sp. COW5]